MTTAKRRFYDMRESECHGARGHAALCLAYCLDVVVIIAGDGYYRGMERHHYFDA